MRLKECENCGRMKMIHKVEYFREPHDFDDHGEWCEECRESFEQPERLQDKYEGEAVIALGLLPIVVFGSLFAFESQLLAVATALPQPVVDIVSLLLVPVVIVSTFATLFTIGLPFTIPAYLHGRKYHPFVAIGEQHRVERERVDEIACCLMCDATGTEGVETHFYREYAVFGIVIWTLESGTHEDCLACHEDPIDMALRASGTESVEVDHANA